MPNTNTTTQSELVVDGYDRSIREALRANAIFDTYEFVVAEDPQDPSELVKIYFDTELAPATTPLDENVDPASVALPQPDYAVIEATEYGNYTIITRKFNDVTWDKKLNSRAATILSNNFVDTKEALIEKVFATGTNILVSTTGGIVEEDSIADATAAADAPFNSALVRAAVLKLKEAKVHPLSNGYYRCYAPAAALAQLREETDPAGWRDAQTYVNTDNLVKGTVGMWEGVEFVEAIGRIPDVSSTVQRSYFVGAEAVGKHEPAPSTTELVAPGGPGDRLNRFPSVGWRMFAGWGLARKEALIVAYTAKTVA